MLYEVITVDLVLHSQAREMVRQRYDDFYAQGVMIEGGLNPFREKMAWLPQGAVPLYNPVGTAPGVLLRVGSTAIISLPGVPPELKGRITSYNVCYTKLLRIGLLHVCTQRGYHRQGAYRQRL